MKKTDLEDLITPESCKFFTIIDLNAGWLDLSPDKWDDNEDYKSVKELTTTVKVTNDVAERGVKMAQDYATMLTKDDSMRAMLLQGVESSRWKYPKLKKKTLTN